MAEALSAASSSPRRPSPRQSPPWAPAELRRDILELAIEGQKRQDAAQVELERQGRLLKISLDEARQVAFKTDATGRKVNQLVEEARDTSKVRRIFRCCCQCFFRAKDDERNKLNEEQAPVSPAEEQQELEEDEVLVWQSFKKEEAKRRGQTIDTSWKQTLAPINASTSGPLASNQIWHRQVEASLVQLQQVAEEMGHTLEEQIQLAKWLDVYLSYGVDQALGANERLADATANGLL